MCAVFLTCFQYTFVSKLKLCFQYTDYVSNLIPMFPIYKLCFQYPIYVSENVILGEKMKMMIKSVFKNYFKSFEIIEKNSSKCIPRLEIL